MPKVKEYTTKTISLSFEELEKTLKTALNLDKEYKLTMRHSGDILWDYKFTAELTKTTEK